MICQAWRKKNAGNSSADFNYLATKSHAVALWDLVLLWIWIIILCHGVLLCLGLLLFGFVHQGSSSQYLHA